MGAIPGALGAMKSMVGMKDLISGGVQGMAQNNPLTQLGIIKPSGMGVVGDVKKQNDSFTGEDTSYQQAPSSSKVAGFNLGSKMFGGSNDQLKKLQELAKMMRGGAGSGEPDVKELMMKLFGGGK